ncbi:hypothetical protein Micbo1qcDRAFT_45951 [Microdochium bolleyi]|uniref:Uncharacterized protein n=1 Tax=Microdochium bolleyi TaxID=196109 RepID=A0A136JC71_9PEZI|nr:hypothetical protein Micbo1qcDRAFT_45951 [Microdochium bolleyi]
MSATAKRCLKVGRWASTIAAITCLPAGGLGAAHTTSHELGPGHHTPYASTRPDVATRLYLHLTTKTAPAATRCGAGTWQNAFSCAAKSESIGTSEVKSKQAPFLPLLAWQGNHSVVSGLAQELWNVMPPACSEAWGARRLRWIWSEEPTCRKVRCGC